MSTFKTEADGVCSAALIETSDGRTALIEDAQHELQLSAQARGNDGIKERVSFRLERLVAASGRQMSKGTGVLATIGSTAPFVGLFGTVWGIYHALLAIGMSGAGTLDKVAGPVGEALIMTAIGLAVAVPAVIFYNLLGRRNKLISDAARHFAYDVDKLMALWADDDDVFCVHPGGPRVVDKAAALAWARVYLPEAVRVTEEVQAAALKALADATK